MTSWIVTIADTYPQHWRIAQEHGFWDMTKRAQISAGDSVYFWLSGASLLRHTVATSGTMPITSDMRQPWEDSGVRTYKARFYFRLKDGEPRSQPRWGEVQRDTGIRPGLNTAPIRTDDPTAEAWLAALFVPAAVAIDLEFDDSVQVSLEEMLVDNRERALRTIALRRGQGAFRSDLLTAYHRRCAVTGDPTEVVLEAAHIAPHRGTHTNVVTNGLLLRADIHTLFDLHLLTITTDLRVRVSPELHASPYMDLDGQPLLSLPDRPDQRPAAECLEGHHQECTWYTEEDPALI